MRFSEKELYAGIKARLLDPAISYHYFGSGGAPPKTIGIYNMDYDNVIEKIPFERDAVFVEFGNYELDDKGGYLCGNIPVILHVVQDLYVTSRSNDEVDEQRYDEKLQYPELIKELLHGHRIDNTKMRVTGIDPDHDHKNLLIHKINITARVRIKTVKITELTQVLINETEEMKAEITLSADQIKNLSSAPVDLIVPSPGKKAVPYGYITKYNPGSESFDSSDSRPRLRYKGTSAIGPVLSTSVETLTAETRAGGLPEIQTTGVFDPEGAILQLYANGDSVNGDGSLEITVLYSEV